MTMDNQFTTFYQNYRKAAGYTQERAAELLGIAVRTLAAYENGERPVPALRAAQMAGLYQNNYLAVQHLYTVAPDLCQLILPQVGQIPLAQAVCQLLSAVRALEQARTGDRLLQIAADGRVDEMEISEFNQLMKELEPLISAVLALKFAEEV